MSIMLHLFRLSTLAFHSRFPLSLSTFAFHSRFSLSLSTLAFHSRLSTLHLQLLEIKFLLFSYDPDILLLMIIIPTKMQDTMNHDAMQLRFKRDV